MTGSVEVTGSAGVPETAAATVSVRGEAAIEADPEIVLFSVSVNARARDRHEALAHLSQRHDAFLELVRSFGQAIEKTETSGVSVSPELRRGREEKVRWYRGTIRTRLTVADFTVAGDLVGRVSDMELCVIDGPWWELRVNSPVYRQTRVAAAQAAVTRAAEYAEAVGGRLTGLLELADTGMSSAAPHPMMSASARARAGSAPGPEEAPVVIDLEPETQLVRASVEARFTMTQPAALRS